MLHEGSVPKKLLALLKKLENEAIFNAKRSLDFFEDVLEESWNEINKFNEKNMQ